MIKKILPVLLVLFICACEPKQEVVKPEYIEPINNVDIIDYVSKDDRDLLYKANGNKDFNNRQFKMLNTNIYDKELIDINGNTINQLDFKKVLLEVISVDCEHCQRTIKNSLDIMDDPSITYIQYFNVGTKPEIEELYRESDLSFKDNIIIIERSQEFEDYLRYDVGLELYPTLLAYDNGKICFASEGEKDIDELETFIDFCFNSSEILNKYLAFIDEDRDINDVRNSLSKENIDKIKHIDNDDRTLDNTLKLIGSSVDFTSINKSHNDSYVNTVDDYGSYQNEDLVLIYTYLRELKDFEKVEYINSLVRSNDDVKYIVVMIEGIDSSSQYYQQMNIRFDCPVASVLSDIPNDFNRLGFSKYPSALFIEKGTYVGAYSNIDSIDNFNYAIDIFFGEDSIALKSNN